MAGTMRAHKGGTEVEVVLAMRGDGSVVCSLGGRVIGAVVMLKAKGQKRYRPEDGTGWQGFPDRSLGSAVAKLVVRA